LAAHCRRRLIVRPVVILAAWLIALQGFVAAVATAQAGGLLASAPAEAAVICHAAGGSGASPAGDATDKARQALHLCCACCTTAAVAVPDAPNGAVSHRRSATAALAAHAFTLVAARGLIRAGPSQGPPSPA